LREAALEIIGPDVQVREVDAAAWSGGETGDLATPSLFGERRALLVTDCRSLPERALGELAAYLAAPVPESPLVLCATVGERGRAPGGLVKLVEPVGEARQVALVETVGEDPAALVRALEQLGSAFAGARITRQLVARQFRGLGDQHVWDLCDRAFGRDLPGAVRSLQALLRDRADGLLVLGGIASRLRDLLRVRALPDRMPPAELARAAGLRFEWQARRYREQARRFTLEELVRLHARVVEADRAMKSGASEDLVLPMLVSAIAGEGTPAGGRPA